MVHMQIRIFYSYKCRHISASDKEEQKKNTKTRCDNLMFSLALDK